MNKIISDFSLCTECRIFELACPFKMLGAYNPRYACLHVHLSEKGLFAEPIICIHCENPSCMKVCPISAISKDNATGAVIIDEGMCTGCRICIESCFYQAIKFDDEKKKAFKCDLCQGNPECVRYCPTGALRFVEVQ